MIFATPAEWRRRRAGNIQAARRCREALTMLQHVTIDDVTWLTWPRFTAEDPIVREAVGQWVARARRAHRVALGREPVIPNFIYVNNATTIRGELYV